MLKDYYQILRISRKASGEDVRRAYRRLAVVFHPDKNRSAAALSLFQDINEAHEVLSDPEKRNRYDLILSGSIVIEAPQGKWHRDPAYRRRQQQGYRPQPSGPSERLLMMVHFLKYMRLVSFIGLGWVGFLVFDYLLPFHIRDEIVIPESNRILSWKFHHVPNVVVTDKGHQFPVPFEGIDDFPVGSHVEIVTSRLLNVLVRVDAENRSFTIEDLATIYQNFMMAPIVLLIISVLGLSVKKGIEYRFNIEVSICIVLGLNVIFLLFSIL